MRILSKPWAVLSGTSAAGASDRRVAGHDVARHDMVIDPARVKRPADHNTISPPCASLCCGARAAKAAIYAA
jgi:hypothetical protein